LERSERLRLEIATEFVNLPTHRLDAAIESALKRIVETIELDRSTINLMSADRGRIEVATHSYAVPGFERVPRLASGPEAYPWTWAMMRANRPVAVARLVDLPAEATADRAQWERLSAKSFVIMPMNVGGKLYGCLTFGMLRCERNWTAEMLANMRGVADMLGSALAHIYARKELDRALDFERLASRILASMFLERPGADSDAIAHGLQDIGQFLGVECVALLERMPQKIAFRIAHYWCGSEATPQLDLSSLSWLGEQLLQGCTVNIGRDVRYAPDSEILQPALTGTSLRSLLAVPITTVGNVSGALLIGSIHPDRSWPDAMVPGVKLIGEVFASLDVRLSAERKREAAEVEAAQWRERLAHLVRVHTAGEMSAALAHEITQPLGAIENYAMAARRRLNSEPPDPRHALGLLDKVIGQATRAGDVVTRMRGMVQRHELEAKSIDLARAIVDCIEMVKMDCELHNIHVEIKRLPAMPAVLADEIHLQQVILNLLRNAMDAMQTLSPTAERLIVVEAGLGADQEVFIDVADRGPGIADADLERVFESFYSTKPNGLGIGLAICRKLVEAHGGTLRAGHNPGGGAVFRLTLPLANSML